MEIKLFLLSPLPSYAGEAVGRGCDNGVNVLDVMHSF
jgi:hypothetical protein